MPFVVVDGGEGAGKTTLLSFLKERFRERDDVIFTREPGGSEFGEELRSFILNKKGTVDEQFFAFWIARLDHVQSLIAPHVKDGKLVISDRFDSSTFAYQIKAAQRPDLEPLFWKVRQMVGNTLLPDHYIHLDVDPAVGLARETDKNHFSDNDVAFHIAVSDGFKEFMKHVPHSTIDANRSKEEVGNDLLNALKNFIPR